jgi:integrase/recombinase XerC
VSDNLPAIALRQHPSDSALTARVSVDLLAAFLNGRSAHTLRAYDGDISDFSKFLGRPSGREAVELLLALPHGDANACALAYRTHLAQRALSPATIRRRLAALQSIVKLARTLGRVNWSLEVDAPSAEAYRDTRGPGLDGWRALLAAAEAAGDTPKAKRDRALLWLLYGRGLRRGEAIGLDLADIDLGTPPPGIWILGKGRSQKERLTVGPAIASALSAWITVRGSAPGPLFVPLDRANRYVPLGRLTGEAVRQIVAELGRKAGLKGPVRPHGLRHAAITRALDLGRDVRDVAKFSRHRDVNTLMIYDDRRKDVGGEISAELG